MTSQDVFDPGDLELLLRDIIDTMRDGGTFEEMSNCDEDSGLPEIPNKLRLALLMATATRPGRTPGRLQ
jgi:hypothetical protein